MEQKKCGLRHYFTDIAVSVSAIVLVASLLTGSSLVYAQSSSGDISWNARFTELIRSSRPTIWGNWSLNTSVKPGAVGTIDLDSGDFQLADNLPNAEINTTEITADWSYESKDIKKSQAELNADGSYRDVASNSVAAGLEVKWEFASSGLVASNFTIEAEGQLINAAGQIQANKDWIFARASDAGMAYNGQITSGFGVITKVIWATSGMNLGSQSDNSAFSISGSVKGVAAMANGGQASGSISGSYSKTHETASFAKAIWPAQKNQLPPHPVPIAFEFASFGDGNEVVQRWTGNLDGFQITLANDHGGTYIVDNELTYEVPGQAEPIKQILRVSGGIRQSFSSIPLDAKNLKLTMYFMTGPVIEKKWLTPLQQIPSGKLTLDIYGVAPNAPEVK